MVSHKMKYLRLIGSISTSSYGIVNPQLGLGLGLGSGLGFSAWIHYIPR